MEENFMYGPLNLYYSLNIIWVINTMEDTVFARV
jgi:hypothetical protein